MIYTSYYENLKNIPDNVYKISISLKTPFGMNFYNCKELCPALEILSSYKDGIIDENGYKELFNKNLNKLNPFSLIKKLYSIAGGNDIVLLCYEKPNDFCHRHLVANWLNSYGFCVNEYGYEEKEIVTSVTGHRPQKLFGYNYEDERYNKLKEIFKEHLINLKTDIAISGCALGADQMFSLAVLELKNDGIPMKLYSAVPFKNFGGNWFGKNIDIHNEILRKSDKVIYISNEDYDKKLTQLQDRNEFLVNASDNLISIFDGSPSGTKNCIDYANKMHKKIINIPIKNNNFV